MRIDTYKSSFGQVSIATQDSFLVGVAFDKSDDLTRYLRKYKNYIIDDVAPSSDIVDKVIDTINTGIDNKLNIHLFGTPFQVKVWNELRNIPIGQIRTYQQIANRIGKPKAVRAVANAIGANPIAIIVPCHRVIRSDGTIGGYRWGKELKKMLLNRETISCIKITLPISDLKSASQDES